MAGTSGPGESAPCACGVCPFLFPFPVAVSRGSLGGGTLVDHSRREARRFVTLCILSWFITLMFGFFSLPALHSLGSLLYLEFGVLSE